VGWAPPSRGQDRRGHGDTPRRATRHGPPPGQGVPGGGLPHDGQHGAPPGATDLSDGELSLIGSHDDVAARDVCANDAHAQALVGIYYDAGASSDDAGSLTAYDADRPFSAANLRLATLVQHDVVADMDAQGWAIPDDGVQTDASLGSFVGDATEVASPARRPTINICCYSDRPRRTFSRHPVRCPGRSSSPCISPIPTRGPSPTRASASR